jgi:hypothetical protein
MEKKVIGLLERVTLVGIDKVSTYAVFDTGAKLTSIDIKLAGKAKVGPVIRTTKVKNPGTKTKSYRPVVRVKLRIRGRTLECEANLQDRSHMTFPMIIGRNVIAGRFIVDASKNLKLFNKMYKRKNTADGQGLKRIEEFANGDR